MTMISGSKIINSIAATPDSFNFSTDYFRPTNFLSIERRGLYEIAWDKFNGTKRRELHLPLKSARFFSSKDDVSFYRLKHCPGEKSKTSKALLVFLLDPWLMPLYLLRDCLQFFKKLSGEHTYESFAFVETYSNFNPLKHTEYVHSFYRIMAEELGAIPKILTHTDLTKFALMQDWMIYEVGTEWLYSDNFIVHLCLSKKAFYLFPELEIFEPKLEIQLSRHHSIQYGKCQFKDAPDPFDLVKMIPPELASTQYSSLSVPDLFIEAIYQNRC